MDTAHLLAAVLGFLERVVWTYVEAFAALLLVGPSIDISTATAAGMAAIPAAVTFAMNAIRAAEIPAGLPFYFDLVLRIAKTYVAGFLGFLVALPVFRLDVGILSAAAMAGIPALLALLKGAAATRLGAETPATLPARRDPLALAAT